MILMNDFQKEYCSIESEIQEAIEGVLKSGWYILGQEGEKFEQEFAEFVGAPYCIGVANGLDALQISLMALGVGEGDEVITVSNTAVATVLAITNVGATPVFVDVDECFLMNIEEVESKITSRTKVLLPVHLFGQMADMTALQALAKKHDLQIVEDGCQAHGARQNGAHAGTIGTLGCFSFYPTKNLGAYGDAGAIVTHDVELYEACKKIRNYGQKNRYHHEVQGLNSRLDELQAAILRVKLRHLPEQLQKRHAAAEQYMQLLHGVSSLHLPQTAKNNSHSFHLFVIQTEKRDALLQHLQQQGISALIHYPVPVHLQECYKDLEKVSLPRTEANALTMLSLPIHPELTTAEITTVCETIKQFFQTA